MSKYRNNLPQLRDHLFVTDGGLETTLIYHEGLDLPLFAAFDLLKDEAGIDVLRRYYRRYGALAREHESGLLLESPTWRANADWGSQLGYDSLKLADANRKAIALMSELRETFENVDTPVVISGNIGPRGDGYRVESRMSISQARDYHAAQIETFAGTEADMVAAFTINYVEEAVGIASAAKSLVMPVAISFTLETDGRLPSGDSLEAAIRRTDEETGGYPAYYMINCAHPTHFDTVLRGGAPWLERIRGLRTNASALSHAELDACTELDAGNPEELGEQHRLLRSLLPKLSVVGGCCGTDHRHVGAICRVLETEGTVACG